MEKPIRKSGLLRFLGVCGLFVTSSRSHVIAEERVEWWREFRIEYAVGLDEDPLEEDLVELLLDAIGCRPRAMSFLNPSVTKAFGGPQRRSIAVVPDFGEQTFA